MRKRSEVRRERDQAERAPPAAPEREWQIDVPNDPVTEQVVLAAMLADEEACDRIRLQCPTDAFYAKPHRRIRAAIEVARIRGLLPDPATLARLDPEVDVSMVERIAQARPEVPVGQDLDFHVDNLRYDAHRARVAQGPLQAFLDAFQDPTAPREKVRALSRQIADAFAQPMGKARYLRDTRHVIDEMMQGIERRKPGLAYPFGIRGLDYDEEGECRLRPGANPGGITLLTGGTGSGKTTTIAHLILGLARQKRRVLVGAWEVRAPMTMEMLAVFSLGGSRSRLLDGYSPTTGEKVPVGVADKAEIRRRAEAIGKWVVFMENPREKDFEDARNEEIVDELEVHVEASGCDVAVWDLLDRALNDRRPEAEEKAMNRLLRMGDRRQIHQILAHQQNPKGDQARADGRPSLGNVKGSSAFINNASLVLAPYIPSRFKNVPETTIEFLGLKQRDGAPFAVEMEWDPGSGRLTGGRTFNPRDLEADETFGGPVSKSFGPRRGKR